MDEENRGQLEAAVMRIRAKSQDCRPFSSRSLAPRGNAGSGDALRPVPPPDAERPDCIPTRSVGTRKDSGGQNFQNLVQFNNLMTSSLIIGIDFDNTIVLYEDLFHRCALEEGLIRPATPKDKKTIRDEIRQLPQGEARWTTLQGVVYGWRMAEAKLADGFMEFMAWTRKNGHHPCIISHKTQYPALGEKIDLRKVARQWMRQQGFFDPAGFGLNPESDVFFEDTLANKLRRITNKKCDIFIDDLEEVLYHIDFPKEVRRIHYTRESVFQPEIVTCASWRDMVRWCESTILST